MAVGEDAITIVAAIDNEAEVEIEIGIEVEAGTVDVPADQLPVRVKS